MNITLIKPRSTTRMQFIKTGRYTALCPPADSVYRLALSDCFSSHDIRQK